MQEGKSLEKGGKGISKGQGKDCRPFDWGGKKSPLFNTDVQTIRVARRKSITTLGLGKGKEEAKQQQRIEEEGKKKKKKTTEGRYGAFFSFQPMERRLCLGE